MDDRRNESSFLTNTTERWEAMITAYSDSVDVGFQVAVKEGDAHWGFACGQDMRGVAIGPGSLFQLYCLCKPFVALAVLDLIRNSSPLALGTELGEIFSNLPDVVAEATIRDILSHRTGALPVPAFAWMLARPENRHHLISDMKRISPPLREHESAYDEVAMWHLLGEVVSVTSGEPWPVYVYELLGDDLTSEVLLWEHQVDQSELIAVRSVQSKHGPRMPALSEAVSFGGCGPDPVEPGFAIRASSRAVAEIMSQTGVLLTELQVLPVRHEPQIDRLLGARSGFAYGLLWDGGALGLNVSRQDLGGHFGVLGSGIAVVCCASGRAVCVQSSQLEAKVGPSTRAMVSIASTLLVEPTR